MSDWIVPHQDFLATSGGNMEYLITIMALAYVAGRLIEYLIGKFFPDYR